MCIGLRFRDVSPVFANHHTEFNYAYTSHSRRPVIISNDVCTFVVGNDAARNFNLAPGRNIARCRLDEEERLFGNCVIQLLYMFHVVSAYGDDLCEM